MKKIFFFLFLQLALLLSGCCNCGKSESEPNTLQGKVVLIGNEPFSKLAIRVDEKTIYLLQCSKELEFELRREQGSLYYIKYSEFLDTENLKTAVIEKAIQLKKSENK